MEYYTTVKEKNRYAFRGKSGKLTAKKKDTLQNYSYLFQIRTNTCAMKTPTKDGRSIHIMMNSKQTWVLTMTE